MATTRTGIDALDLFLRGGLPEGFTTLVLAPSGSGVETFAKQFACGAAGGRSLYVTTDESRREVETAMEAAGWDTAAVEVVDLQTEFASALLEEQQRLRDEGRDEGRRFDPRELVERSNSFDLLQGPEGKRPARRDRRDYLGHLIDPYTSLRPPDRMVVHSLDFFLNLYSLERVAAAMTALRAANARLGSQLLLVMAKGAHGQQLERRLELMADCLIDLEVTRKGTTFERFFMVKKVKNRAHGVGISTYDVTPTGFHLETLERIV